MRFYEATATINARRDAVWSVLTDAASYPEWESGVVRVEGRVAPGEKIKVVSEANPKRAFPVTVSEFAAPSKMVWSGGMPMGLFKGVRTFRLTPAGDATKFTMREEYTGPFLPMIWKSMPDLQPSFDKFARGLKQRAEQTT